MGDTMHQQVSLHRVVSWAAMMGTFLLAALFAAASWADHAPTEVAGRGGARVYRQLRGERGGAAAAKVEVHVEPAAVAASGPPTLRPTAADVASHVEGSAAEADPPTLQPAAWKLELAAPEQRAALAPLTRRALALQGGGILSVAGYTGITSALLNVYAAENGLSNRSVSGSGLLGSFDIVSSVSGGTWFAAALIYDDSFDGTLEEMAKSPDDAGETFQSGWLSKWMKVGSPHTGWDSFVKATARFFQFSWFWQTFAEASYVWKRGKLWTDFAATLLGATAKIGPDLQLGDAVTPWATNKTWLICHSVVPGSRSDPVTLWQEWGVSVRYDFEGSGSPKYIPAKFSVVLGAGTESSAPQPYMSEAAAASLGGATYAKTALFQSRVDAHLKADAVDTKFPALTTDAGKLPVVSVAAASSAALGGALLQPWLLKLNNILQVGFAPWVSTARHGAAFAHAEHLVHKLKERDGRRQADIDELAKSQVRGLIDAGYTDDTGIVNSIASGATDVVAFMHTKLDRPRQLMNLFRGGDRVLDRHGIQTLFFQAFEATIAEAEEWYDKTAKLEISPGKEDEVYLEEIRVGSLNVTTVESKWFGIEAGTKVTLHMVCFKTQLGIGFFEDFPSYDELVQQIVSTLTAEENRPAAKDHILTKMFPKPTGTVDA